MYLSLIEYDKKGNPQVLKTYMECSHEEWIAHCKLADDAIQFKEKYTELERFNALHTNLLLTNLIKQGVLKKTGVDIDPLVREKIRVEVARDAWHFSRKKKLMQQMEYAYEKSKGTFKEKIWSRVWSEAFEKVMRFMSKAIPQPIKDMWEKVKITFKNLES